MMRSGNDVILFCCDTRGPSALVPLCHGLSPSGPKKNSTYTTGSLSLGRDGRTLAAAYPHRRLQMQFAMHT